MIANPKSSVSIMPCSCACESASDLSCLTLALASTTKCSGCGCAGVRRASRRAPAARARSPPSPSGPRTEHRARMSHLETTVTRSGNNEIYSSTSILDDLITSNRKLIIIVIRMSKFSIVNN